MTPDALLQLQLTDSAIDQLKHRLPKLPEVVAAAAADAEVTAWVRRAAELFKAIADYDAAIATAEHANEAIGKQRARLEAQLKTVIAPREAEALMHEIATVNAKRSALDDDELAALDGLAGAEIQMAEHNTREPLVRDAAAAAGAAAAAARAASDAETAELTAKRDELRAAMNPAMLRRYDEMRSQHNGVAIAKSNGLRCEGCHLDLSRGEVDEIKRMPEDEMPECPNCGRLLVR